MEVESTGKSKVAVDRVYRCAPRLSVPFALVTTSNNAVLPFHRLPSCHSPPLSREALAPGELHNSWPCYTPTASPTDPLLEGPTPANPSPASAATFSLPSTSSPPGFPGSTLARRVIVRQRARYSAA